MWHLALYAVVLIVIGIVSFEGFKHVRDKRAKEAAEKAAEEAGLTVEARERMVNQLLFAPTLDEITARARAMAQAKEKAMVRKDNVIAPEGFFIGDTWTEKLHILYTEAIAADLGVREHPAFYDAGLNTFVKRKESIERLVAKYRAVRSPTEFHRNLRLAQEYLEPILIQMCARPNSERGALKAVELEAFSDALGLSYTLCPGSWRGLAEVIKFFAQDATVEDLIGLGQNGKRTLKAIALQTMPEKAHKTGVLLNALAKAAIVRISRKCSFDDAAARSRVEKPEWDTHWRQGLKPAPAAGQTAADQSATPTGDDAKVVPDTRRLCAYIECFEVEGRPEGENGKPAKFMRCSKCKLVAYCSVECQTKHWKAGHKTQCAELAKKAALVAQKMAAAKKAAAAAALKDASASSSASAAEVVEEKAAGVLKERKKAAAAK